MGIRSTLANWLRPVALSATDDFWYNPVGQATLTGLRVDPDTAMRVSAVWACVRLISETMASLPLNVYRRLPDDEREKATEHYLYRVLRHKPNDYQTPFEFKSMLTAHVLLRGNGYARILPGRAGFASALLPLHPGRVEPEWMDGAGRWHADSNLSPEVGAPIRYVHQGADGRDAVYSDSEIFHIRGPWTRGLRGMGVVEMARESIGLSMATEQYGARFFSQNAEPGVVLKHPGKLSEEAQKRLKSSWDAAHSGVSNAHRTAVLEEGMDVVKVGMTNEDAQFLMTRDYQVADVGRWFGVPLHMIQETSKSTSWGTGLEEMTLGFISFCLGPWACRWEESVARDLITDPDQYYAEYEFNKLERGNLKARYEAYQMGRMGGWLSGNDVRRKENMNPVDGGDIYWRPANMVDANAPEPEPAAMPQPFAPQPEPTPPANPDQEAHYLRLVYACAQRVMRREVGALTKLAKKHSDDNDAWAAAVTEFYGEHADYIMAGLGLGRETATDYCQGHAYMVINGGAGRLQDMELDGIPALMALAQGGHDGN